MYPHLKRLIEQDKRSTKPIMTISQIEAEIVMELVDIFQKLGRDELKDIMRMYKEVSDEDIRDLFIEWNLHNDNSITNDSNTVKYVEFDDLIIKASLITKISKGEYFSQKEERMKYYIIVNEDPSDRTYYANTRQEFVSKVKRDHTYKKLKKQLAQNGVQFI